MICAKCGKELNELLCSHCGYDHRREELVFLLQLPRTAPAPFTGREQGMDIVNGELIGYFGREPIVEVPETVTRIGPRAFASTDVQRVALPKTLRSIGEGAFEDCKSLQHIIIPDSVTEIENNAFDGCLLLDMALINANVEVIPNACFAHCSNLRTLGFGNSVKVIGRNAFLGCSGLRVVTLPKNLERIEDWAFAFCEEIGVLDVPLSLTEIGNNAFHGTHAKNVICRGDVHWRNTHKQLWDKIKNT